MTDVELWRDQQAVEELAARFVQNTTEQRRARLVATQIHSRAI